RSSISPFSPTRPPPAATIFPYTTLFRSSEEHEDQYLLFRAVTGFVEAIAETQPVALLIDDMHWADDSSVRLLHHLARYTRGISRSEDTRLNSSHVAISYAVFCLKKKKRE